MELSIKPYPSNTYPLGGVLVRGEEPALWIREIEAMGLPLLSVAVYPLPGRTANSVWGCLLVLPNSRAVADIGRNSYCQLAGDVLFIPERSVLYPAVSPAELKTLFPSGRSVLHPEFGLVELDAPINWSELLTPPEEQPWQVKAPALTVALPAKIKSFQVKPVAAENALQQLEERHFPKRQPFEDRPLNPLEKVRLYLYRQLFRKDQAAGSSTPAEKTPLLRRIESLVDRFTPKGKEWTGDLQLDYEALEKRNQKHLDRLLDMLKNNPEEALKYAIPLDEGVGRGMGGAAYFDLQKRWFDFSLFGNTASGGGGVVFADDTYQRLQGQYMQTAQELVRRKEFRKAAFVYLKLLKNYHLAAQTLEEGKHYAEAASVYLKYVQNKEKAAQCYEKGAMTTEAIALYGELGKDEKVGDLYMSLHRQREAFVYYEKVVEGYKASYQYLKASLLCRDKMGREAEAQDLLLQGWRMGRDGVNCLSAYFSNIREEKVLEKELRAIYSTADTGDGRETFLQVLKPLHKKHSSLTEIIEDMAYEIITGQLPSNPSVVTELNAFHKNDKQLLRDTFRFKVAGKKKL